MKKYALFAVPVLVILVSLLIWLLQNPSQISPAKTLPIQPVVQVPEPHPVDEEMLETPASVTLDKSTIADANTLTTSVLENSEVVDIASENGEKDSEASDQAVLSYVGSNLDPKLNQWLVQDHIISKFVRALSALEEGKLVSKYRPIEMPTKAFVAQQNDGTWTIAQDNYSRYTPYIVMLESIGEDGLMDAYKKYYPALNDAYNDLGVDKGDFDGVSKRALEQLLKAPEFTNPPTLTHKSVIYKYENAQLEDLPEAQKLMIRMGPENSRRLKVLIRKIIDKM